jgi:hypothetical protein
MKEDKIEQKKRTDLVIGIAVAAVIGFVLNLLANLYYDIFITGTLTWNKVNHTQVYAITLALVGLIGLLEFFIYDYKNDLEENKGFLKRYFNYFFYNFTPGKIIRIIAGLYVSSVLIGLMVLLYAVMAIFSGYLMTTAVFLAAFLKIYLDERQKRRIYNARKTS